MVLVHEFDNNIAVVATTVASITTGIVQFRAKSCPRRSLVQVGGSVCVPAGRVRGAIASGGSGLGSGARDAGIFQHPSHHEPQMTICEHCECQK